MPYSIPFLRKLADSSRYYFTKIIGGSAGSGGDISPDLHKIVMDILDQRKLKRHGKLFPRYWRKTTAFTVLGSIYDYLQNPEERQLIISENLDLASGILFLIQKHLLYNQMLRKLYPDKLGLINEEWRQKYKWNETTIELPRSGIYRDYSFKAMGATAAKQGGHFTKIRIDDLIGDAARESPVIMKKACLLVDGLQELLAEPNRNHPEASVIDICGTHYAPGDAYVYMQENYYEYEWFIVPALKNTELKNTLNITYIQNSHVGHNESNWPDKYPTEHYEEMKSGEEKSVIFWTQHQNDPNKATQLTKFEGTWIRWYHLEVDLDDITWLVCERADGKDGEKFKLKDIKLYGMIDPAGFKELKMITKGARNVILIGGQPDSSKKKFVIFTWCGRPKEPETVVNEVFAAHQKWTPRLWKIDSTGNDMLAIIKNSCKTRGRYLPVSSLSVDTRADSKDIDILSLVDPMHNGEIWLHHSMKELIGEIKGYPGALTKDLLDMLAKLNRYFWTRRTRDELKKLNRDTSSVFVNDGRSRTTGY